MKLRIRHGRVIDPANSIDKVGDVCIDRGCIVSAGKSVRGFTADREIDARGMLVIPGIVDMGTRLREPGAEHKATIASECAAAAHSGITTLCCPPDTDPVIDTPTVLELIEQRATASKKARVVAIGALTQGLKGELIAEMGTLKDAGCVGVSNAQAPMINSEVLRRAMEYAATFDLTIFIHALEPSLHNNGKMHYGAVSTRLGIPASPETAETVDVARHLLLIEQTGVRAHFCRLSTARAASMIKAAQGRGLPITADVAMHQLHLNETSIIDFDSAYHVQPPLRGKQDMAGLRKAVANGTISAICSDHQPHELDAKEAPFSASEPGISGLETLLPLGLDLVSKKILDLTRAIAALTCNPANILGIDAGTLSVAARADVCIVDPGRQWVLDKNDMTSVGHNTPFDGWQMTGTVMHTLLNGRIVYSA